MDFGVGDETPLWERLVHGDCTRVVLLSPNNVLGTYFPQSLGLLPMSAYQYRITGDLETAVEELAAKDRWMVEGDLWTRYFMPRAQVILSVEIPFARNGSGRRFPRFPARRRSGDSVLDMAIEEQSRWPLVPLKSVNLALAEDEYPEKLIRLTTRRQIQILRKVRARD